MDNLDRFSGLAAESERLDALLTGIIYPSIGPTLSQLHVSFFSNAAISVLQGKRLTAHSVTLEIQITAASSVVQS